MRRKVLSWVLMCSLVMGAAQPAYTLSASGGMVELIVELSGEPALLSGASARSELAARQDRLVETIRALPGGGEAELRGRYVTALNAVALLAPAALGEEIKNLPGVERVRRAASFQAPEDLSDSQAEELEARTADAMVGLEDAGEQGLDGSGVVIAVIDTGMDTRRASFSAREMDEDAIGLDLAGVEEVLGELNAFRLCPQVRSEDVWRSAKVPFAFNYARGSADMSQDKEGSKDHGTHVAAIAAGVESAESAAGAAPGAQILAMEVFEDGGAVASEVSILDALEDAAALGADVINLSLGTVSGFSDGEGLAYAQAIQNAVEAGIVVCAAAGNEFSSAYGNVNGKDLSSTANVDVGVVDEPSSLDGVFSVASVNNAQVYASGFYLHGEDGARRFISIGDNGPQYGLRGFETLGDDPNYWGGVYPYVVVPGLGSQEDFDQVDVKGKIALIARGELTFVEKCDRAWKNGAAAVVIRNNEAQPINMDLSDVARGNHIPCVIVSREDGERMVCAAGESGVGKLTVASGATMIAAKNGWQPSSFSSWGPLSDLTLKPDAAGVGGNVYSVADKGSYEGRSGTSMAAPQAAGVAALLLQYLRESQGLDKAEASRRARTLLLNTAIPMRGEDGVEYSPRKQGAGLLSAGRAVTTPVWLTVDGNDLPKAELGDDKDWKGVYAFAFTAHNPSSIAQTYTLRASILTETEEDGLMLQQARRVEAETTFSGQHIRSLTQADAEEVTVPAGGEAQMRVTVRLSEAEKKALRESFENGVYIEGYIFLEAVNDTAPDLSIPMLAFYGDWGLAPLFEDTMAGEVDAAKVVEEGRGNCPIPFHIQTGPISYLGENPVEQDFEYIPERSNALNTGSGRGGVVSNIAMDLLRNARSVTVEMVDSRGGVLYSTTAHNVVKSCLLGDLGEMYPAMFNQYGELSFDPVQYGLKDGDVFTIRVTGEKVADGPHATETMELPVYVDSSAPVFTSARLRRVQGRSLLTVEIRDNFYTAGVRVIVKEGGYDQKSWPVDQNKRGEAVTMELDVTELAASGGTLTVQAMDYAWNLASCDVES